MTTASRLPVVPGPAVAKFCEARPSPTMRRDEKIRQIARSVQEITESEEEEDDSQVFSSQDSVRSPFALTESPSMQRRCFSIGSPLSIRMETVRHSPKKWLARGFSDPCLRRPSFGSQPMLTQEDGLGLPPIPEAATPINPAPPNSLDLKDDAASENLDLSPNS